ncbi:hypothetical protein ACP2AV_01755 [Aliiroseovarius sp. PTFE2010]|uniref:hypothetical protein n=1 Tax=Aliiroseovarius sp. PTFE2010 TaxID=3417190 RepID=UPI003CEF9A32
MPRPTLYIHVGLPKTGTTSFQVFCMRNRAWLAEQGICYPPTMCAPHPTASQHRYVNSAMRASLQSGSATNVLTRLTQDILESGLPRALISEEQFSYDSFLSAPFLGALRSSFDCRILLVLRRQDRWAESMYAQAVRGGYKHSFQTFLGAGATRERLDHHGLVALWEEAFGPGNVNTLTYPEDGSSSLDLLLGFLELAPCVQATDDRFNVSLGAEAIAFIRALDLPKDAYGFFNQSFSKMLRDLTDPTPFSGFDPAARAEFFARWTGASATFNDEPPLTTLDMSKPRQRELLQRLVGACDTRMSIPELTRRLAQASQADRAA